ncbi:glucose 1-dehydrogenase [Peloplasma aerotolerans]|jgi:3alpha(or 20beta)-hydroxysteroid dehydrogenase|uniref:Glucose 1-dehydrogenase n=1 Tax=Peloplasma aerotolerans TaxID=3044389 RepID=A0AAW6U3K8_9MOLU|nr:glucose 1-dehydrogenase [Mariniplasma sp. M4Ah]MDI6452556.1 glucose 1-dehydrogenase [Mariniplasma sp. M4Ah]
MGKLDHKVAIITGAAQGIGAATAQLFIKEGAFVVLTDVQDDKGKALAKSLGDKAIYMHHDVSIRKDWEHVLKETEKLFGPVSILINNAGIVIQKSLEEYTDEDFHKLYMINQFGVYLGMMVTYPSMEKVGRGAIVNISSTSGFRGKAGLMGYNASKFAVRGMTKSAALDFASKNIRVNSVHPGFINTPMTLDHISDEYKEKAMKDTPLGRGGEPEEVAQMILFLSCDDSSFSTGSEFITDGGRLA